MKNKNLILVKEEACIYCHSWTVIDPYCQCTYSNVPTVELEFEHCECCGHTISEPADTEFNYAQLKKLEENE